MLHVCIHLHLLALGAVERTRVALVARGDRGQSTAEYALVLLGAAAVALLLLAWAGKTDRIGKLMNSVIDQILGKIG
jgi:hypothetical protein